MPASHLADLPSCWQKRSPALLHRSTGYPSAATPDGSCLIDSLHSIALEICINFVMLLSNELLEFVPEQDVVFANSHGDRKADRNPPGICYRAHRRDTQLSGISLRKVAR